MEKGKIRDIAIIAQVSHRKTTPIDAFLEQTFYEKTKSWILTPVKIRDLGGALF